MLDSLQKTNVFDVQIGNYRMTAETELIICLRPMLLLVNNSMLATQLREWKIRSVMDSCRKFS